MSQLYSNLQNGFLSALPYLGACLVANASGFVADFVIARRMFSLTLTRKIFTLAGEEDNFLLHDVLKIKSFQVNNLHILDI